MLCGQIPFCCSIDTDEVLITVRPVRSFSGGRPSQMRMSRIGLAGGCGHRFNRIPSPNKEKPNGVYQREETATS